MKFYSSAPTNYTNCYELFKSNQAAVFFLDSGSWWFHEGFWVCLKFYYGSKSDVIREKYQMTREKIDWPVGMSVKTRAFVQKNQNFDQNQLLPLMDFSCIDIH